MPDVRDVEITARTAWGEARGEGREGMEAVASVVSERARRARAFAERTGRAHPLYGDGTLEGACLAHVTRNGRTIWQFSCWGDSRERLEAVTESSASFRVALEVAAAAVAGALVSRVGAATHYHTIAKPSWATTWPPAWAVGRTPCATVRRHIFYDLGEG